MKMKTFQRWNCSGKKISTYYSFSCNKWWNRYTEMFYSQNQGIRQVELFYNVLNWQFKKFVFLSNAVNLFLSELSCAAITTFSVGQVDCCCAETLNRPSALSVWSSYLFALQNLNYGRYIQPRMSGEVIPCYAYLYFKTKTTAN